MSGHNLAGARPVISLGIPEFVLSASEPVLCRTDPAAYFSDRVKPAGARRLCEGCLYLDACGAYALAHPGLHGVWGGTTARERQALRRGERGPPGCWVVGCEVGRTGWSVALVVSRNPGRRCAVRVTGRADQGVTGMTITAEMVAAAEAEVTAAERQRDEAEQALMDDPSSTARATELTRTLRRVAQCRVNARELREMFEAQEAEARAAATREDLEKAAVKEIAAAGKELKGARGRLEDAATAAQRALVELMRQTEAHDDVVARHAAILSALGLDAAGASGGADTVVGSVVRVKGDAYETAGSGSVLAYVVYRVAEARLPQPNYMAGVLDYNMGRVVPEDRADGLLAGLEAPEVRNFPEIPPLRVASY